MYGSRTGWLVFAGVALSLLPAVSQGDDASDRRWLSGRWTGHVADPRGERPGPIRFQEVVITTERISAKGVNGGDMGSGSYRLGTEGRLRTLDTQGLAGEPRGKTYLGIVESQGDTLRWCVANPGRPRPTEFASRPSAGQFLMVLRRAPQ
jgi:uncharacterized protein (TIGR03067 family)